MQLIKKRRVHRLVVVEGDVSCASYTMLIGLYLRIQEEERKGGKKGRLLGIISLSDVLRYLVGEVAIGEVVEEPTLASTPTTIQGLEEAQAQSG